MNLEEKTKLRNLIYKGRILDFYNDTITLPNGKEAMREYVDHKGGSGILAIDNQDYVYLVEQFRYPYGEIVMEIPAGKIDDNEDYLSCAIRELQEETGIMAKDIIDLGVIYPSPGYTNEPLHIYVAKHFAQGDSNCDDGEFINLVRISFSEALDMVMSGKIKDSKTCIAILKYNVIKNNA